nr:NADH dehydrogenase subunit 2 [Plerochila australis]
MMKYNKKKLFLIIMIMSCIMVMSSSSWLSIWIGMEINLMTNIPFLFNNKSKNMSEKIMIYLLIQVMGSIIMLLVILTKNMIQEMDMNIILTMSMMIKLGVPPFHPWMPEMLNKLKWNTMIVMITIQKINPMIVLSQIMNQNYMSPLVMIMAASIGSISGINQLSLNKIIAYSSINHLSWIVMNMMMTSNIWINFFIIYSLINLTMCLVFKKMNVYFMNQLTINTTIYMKMMMFVMLMNLGGMPPFPGFMLKWLTLEYMISSSMYFVMTVMLVSSMVAMLFYMRMMYLNIMSSSMNFKFKTIKFNKNLNLMLIMNLMLPMMILI